MYDSSTTNDHKLGANAALGLALSDGNKFLLVDGGQTSSTMKSLLERDFQISKHHLIKFTINA